MRRFFFLLPVTMLAWPACKDQEIVVIKADAGDTDSGPGTTTDSGKVDQPPTGTVTDSGVSGRRLGDRGCKTNDDCDSNLCFLAALEADNFCTANCTKETAPEVCVAPLKGSCSRQLVCDPSE